MLKATGEVETHSNGHWVLKSQPAPSGESLSYRNPAVKAHTDYTKAVGGRDGASLGLSWKFLGITFVKRLPTLALLNRVSGQLQA